MSAASAPRVPAAEAAGRHTVLLAPDKFKGSLSAAQVVAALAHGISRAAPDARILSCPIADGGDGTVDAALSAGYRVRTTTVTGPTGQARTVRWALGGGTAVVELADAVGLRALPEGRLAPWTASTRGLGELILAAVTAGARTVMVGLGGSASTDAGAGMLQALGARLRTADGEDIGPGARGLAHLHEADLDPARQALADVTLIAASDVTNPLLGSDGAAAVYGPQKGIAAQQTEQVDQLLADAAAVLDPSGQLQGREGAGAAGGTGFGLFLLGARQRSGADAVLELADFDSLLAQADLVVTGEGKLDEQTLQGKGPAEVARRARARGVPVHAVAGAITLDAAALERAGFIEAHDLVSSSGSVEQAVARAEELLVEVGRVLGRHLGPVRT